MKTPEQLKGSIRSMAAKKNLRAQEVLQMFLFERVLERLAESPYRNNFILKGGLLISSRMESASGLRWIWTPPSAGSKWKRMKSLLPLK